MGDLSLCYMVRNEEDFLEDSIRSVGPIASEILVFDTGSTDQTLKIVERLKNEFPQIQSKTLSWKDDFAWARNEIAKLATHDWILFVDGDEVLDSAGRELIHSSLIQAKADSYSLIQRNYTYDSQLDDLKPATELPSFLQKSTKPLYYFDNQMERLYRKSSGLFFEGRIHESLLPVSRRLGLRHECLPVRLHHYGRLKPTQNQKLHYYLQLSTKKLEEQPKDPTAWVECAVNLIELGENLKAFELMQLAIKEFPNEKIVLRTAYQCALRADHFSLAEVWINQYLDNSPNDLYSLGQRTTALLYQAKFEECIEACKALLHRDKDLFIAHLNLGISYFELKNYASAKPHLKAAAAQRPNDTFLKSALEKLETR